MQLNSYIISFSGFRVFLGDARGNGRVLQITMGDFASGEGKLDRVLVLAEKNCETGDPRRVSDKDVFLLNTIDRYHV